MAVASARIGHEDRLSLVDHLSELRGRLIVSLAALAVAFGLCMWQNHALLSFINKPLSTQTQKQVKKGNGPLGATYAVQQSARTVATQLRVLTGALDRPGSGVSPATRAALAGVDPQLQRAIKGLSKPPEGNKPVTLGIGEPFATTIGVALIFAFILALPIILYELYGFLLPAFSPPQQRVANSLVMSIPLLFVAGVAFGYFVVLPAAVRFFQNFNSGEFNVLVQANQYYHFAAVTLLAMGLVFQIPVAILAATRAQVVTPKQLRQNRRYAVLACGAVAAFLPGDAITLVLETVPLYLLFELSLLLASFAERRSNATT
ncbi:MAG TPA: twin-arginine translocase subunit TatC [Solirubrobacteraceae bacterium]|nr:twin-arginine translocase subunit TatC [Solirubrobacteraceae bacterium]